MAPALGMGPDQEDWALRALGKASALDWFQMNLDEIRREVARGVIREADWQRRVRDAKEDLAFAETELASATANLTRFRALLRDAIEAEKVK